MYKKDKGTSAQRRVVQARGSSANGKHMLHGSLTQIRKLVSGQLQGCKQPPGGGQAESRTDQRGVPPLPHPSPLQNSSPPLPTHAQTRLFPTHAHTELIQRAAVMQGGGQLVRSNQKRLDEVRRIRDAIATGRPVLTEQERSEITQHAASLGKDWEALVEELLVRVKELASQQADILRMIESYISELGKRVTLRELSLDLEKEMATERTAQLKTMEVEVEKLRTAFRGGNMASITQGYKALKDQLDKYI